MAPALKAAAPVAAALGLLALAACVGPALKSHGTAGLKALPGVPRLSPTPSPAPTPAAVYPQRRPLNRAAAVRVRSRSLRYDRSTQETVFYGGVTATQDSTTMLSRELRSQTQGQSARATGGVLLSDEQRRVRVRSGEADYTDSLREALLFGGVHLVSVDPYGASVTVTGQEGAFSDLSRSARVDGGVKVLLGPLVATAVSATVQDGGVQLLLEEDVRAAMGINRLQSQRALFDQKSHSVDLQGDVRVRVVPDQVRGAAAAPWSLSPSAREQP